MEGTAEVRDVHRFDAGAFWDAHEVWERYWRDAAHEDERRVFHGLIQVAAAFHQLAVLGAREPAERLFAKALAKFRVECADAPFDVAAFGDRVAACLRALREERFDDVRSAFGAMGADVSRIRVDPGPR